MFNFQNITHFSRVNYPEGPVHGKISLCGSVPTGCYDWRPATQSDVMGGRAKRVDGAILAPKKRFYDTVEQAIQAIQDAGGKACDNPECACSNLR